MDTKEKILEISLSLFSKNGFSAVSIRDICKQVEIKESSVYYHFKNKRAILDEIILRFQKKATDMMQQMENAMANSQFSAEGNFYQNVCDCFFEGYLMDSFCNKVMRLLSIEQYSDEEIKQVWDKWLFKEPLEFQSKIFSQLVLIGFVKECDSNYLAVKYYAPIFFYFQRWLLSGEFTEDNKNLFRMNAYAHIQKFFAELEV